MTWNLVIGLVRRVVLEEEADTLQDARAELLVHAGRILEREDPGDEGLGIDFFSCYRIDKAVKIASLGPPHIASWVVDSFDFVLRVISAGTVRAGEPEVEFLLVVIIPRQIQLHLANVDHRCSVPCEACRKFHRLIGGTSSNEENAVGTKSARGFEQRLFHCPRSVVVRRSAQKSAGLLRQTASFLVWVQSDHLNAGGHEQLHDQLPDQTQADNARGISDLDVSLANPLQSDRAHSGKCRQLRRHAIGYGHTEIGRYPVDFGMKGKFIAGACHQLTDGELLSPFSHLEHHTRKRVTQG